MKIRFQQKVVDLPILEGIDRQSAVWLVLMSLMLFMLLLPVESYVAALSHIKDEWGLNNTEAGTIYSVYLVGYVIAALFLVPLTDRLGPKRILLGSAALSVVAHMLFPLVAYNMVSGAALRFVAGAGFFGIYIPGLRILSERFSGASRGAAMGLFVTAQYAAHSGSLAVTGALMANLEWRSAYSAVSVLAVVGLPMACMLLRAESHKSVDGPVGRFNPAVLANPAVRYLILGYSLHAMQLYAVRVWLPMFLTAILVARGIASSEAAATAATMGGAVLIVGSIGPFMGGMISDRWGRVQSASAIFALSGTCSLLIGWVGDLPWALIVAVGVVYGWAIAADSAIYQTGVTEVADPMHLGSTMAVQASGGLLGGVAGPIVFGGVLDLAPETYRWVVAFSTLGLLAVVAISGFQRLRTTPQSRLMAGGKG